MVLPPPVFLSQSSLVSPSWTNRSPAKELTVPAFLMNDPHSSYTNLRHKRQKVILLRKSGRSCAYTFRPLYPRIIAHHATSFMTSIQEGSSTFVVFIKSVVSVFANKTHQIFFFWIRLYQNRYNWPNSAHPVPTHPSQSDQKTKTIHKASLNPQSLHHLLVTKADGESLRQNHHNM